MSNNSFLDAQDTLPDKNIIEIIDTVVTFDPDTKMSKILLVKSVNESFTNRSPRQIYDITTNDSIIIDTLVVFDPETYEETVSVIKKTVIRDLSPYEKISYSGKYRRELWQKNTPLGDKHGRQDISTYIVDVPIEIDGEVVTRMHVYVFSTFLTKFCKVITIKHDIRQ